MNRLKEAFLHALANLQDRWELLPPEDQKRYRIVALIVTLLLGLLLLSPFLKARFKAYARVKGAEADFRKVLALEEELYARGIVPAERKSRGAERSLLGTVEQLARRAEISSKISSMRPLQKGNTGQEGIELELHDLVLEQALRFLYLLEGEGKLLVARLELGKEIRNPNRLKLNLEVLTP